MDIKFTFVAFFFESAIANFIVATLTTTALSATAALLQKKDLKQSKSPVNDHKPNTTSSRGSIVPRLIGRRRIAPVIGWVGDRKSIKVAVGSTPGGKGGGSETVYDDRFLESAWHLLSVGPAYKLHKIYESGKVIWSGGITRTSHPSGSTVDLGKRRGQFTVYWGEEDQPVDSTLLKQIGVQSRWPFTCYIVWKNRKLGSVPTWPVIDYELEVLPLNTTITSDIQFLSDRRRKYTKLEEEATEIGATLGIIKNDADNVRALELAKGRSVYIGLKWNAGQSAYIWADGSPLVFQRWAANEPPTNGANAPYVSLNPEGYWETDDGEIEEPVEVRGYIQRLETVPLNRRGIFERQIFDTDDSAEGFTPLEESNSLISSDAGSTGIIGANPAHALYEMFCAPFPHGAGFSESSLNRESFERIGILLESERYPCHMLFEEGESYKDMARALMNDTDLFFFWDFYTGRHHLGALRSPSSYYQIPEELVIDTPEIWTTLGETLSDGVSFIFPDIDRNYRTSSVTVDNDVQARRHGARKISTEDIHTAIDITTANKMAQLRAQQIHSKQSLVEFVIARGALNIRVGEVIAIPDFEGSYIVVSNEPSTEQDEMRVQCIFNHFGVRTSTRLIRQREELKESDVINNVPLDLHTDFIEMPRFLTDSEVSLVPLRIRGSEQVSGANYYLSSDNGTYVQVSGGNMNTTGGTLTETVSIDGESYLEDGPTFKIEGPDIAEVEDLDSRQPEWRQGRQILVVGNEVCYLRSIEIDSNTLTAQCKGILRARWGTKKQDWTLGTPIFIFLQTETARISDISIEPNSTVYMKAQPLKGATAADLAVVPAVQEGIKGSQAPLGITNLRGGTNKTDVYYTGQDIPFGWQYLSSASKRSGAGMMPLGDAWSPALPQGFFTIIFRTMADEEVGRFSAFLEPSYTLTNSDLIEYYGTEPSQFKVVVIAVDSGLQTPEVERTITLLN